MIPPREAGARRVAARRLNPALFMAGQSPGQFHPASGSAMSVRQFYALSFGFLLLIHLTRMGSAGMLP